ncbi:MAG: glycosyltransferase [Chitinophagaceae bacterium]
MEVKPPYISICIPAYRNVMHLQRLLASVATQTFTDYEIVITDDSPDDSVKELVTSFAFTRPVRYVKNLVSLGSPENWNESIRQAAGIWIKLMHNDDWLASPDALDIFVKTAAQHPSVRFFFSAFCNITESNGHRQEVRCNTWDRIFMRVSPLHLFKRVYVGNPSCTFIRNDIGLLYDRRLKFVVDFEYYIRCIRQEKKYQYIDQILVNVGFHQEQVTGYTKYAPSVQIPENVLLLEKFGTRILRNPFVYDYYWRLIRNLKIRSVEEAQEYSDAPLPYLLQALIHKQVKVSPGLLNRGVFSKLLMSGSYILDFFKKR